MKKMTITKIALVLLMTISSGLCYPSWLKAIESEEMQLPTTGKDSINPVEVFDQAWQLINSNYPFFDQQGIDWMALYKVYRPKVSPATSEDELFTILCDMLEHFNSGHINLETGSKRFCSNVRINAKMEVFSWEGIGVPPDLGKANTKEDNASITPSFPWERNLVAEARKSLGKNTGN